MMTIDDPHACRLQVSKSSTNGDQVRMHQLNQRAAEQKVKPDERDQRRGIVEHPPGRFLHLPALLDEICFQNFPQSAETSQRFNNFFYRRAPGERVWRYNSVPPLNHITVIIPCALFDINLL